MCTSSWCQHFVFAAVKKIKKSSSPTLQHETLQDETTSFIVIQQNLKTVNKNLIIILCIPLIGSTG